MDTSHLQTLSKKEVSEFNDNLNTYMNTYKITPTKRVLKDILIDLNVMGYDLKWTPKEITRLSKLKKSMKKTEQWNIMVALETGLNLKTDKFINIEWNDKQNKYIIDIK